MEKQNEFKRIGKHLYRSAYRTKKGDWIISHFAIFRDWQGRDRKFRLSGDLKTARGELNKLEHENFEHVDFDAKKREAEEKKRAEREGEMTVARWAPLCAQLPEVRQKRSLNRDGQLYSHIVGHLGGRPLPEISRQDLFNYIEARRGETIIRGGKPSKVKVKDGTIRNELASLRRMLNLAADRGLKTSGVSFKGVLPDATNRDRVLNRGERERLLQTCPPWLRRLVVVGLETSLSRGDLLRLTWDMIDEQEGVIVPAGGRKKTGVEQAAPLTDEVRRILEEIRDEGKKAKIESISGLVFTRDGKPITGNMITKMLGKACMRANVRDFRFHDLRHCAKTNWARAGIPVEIAMLAAGHSSIQMHQAYVHLQKTDVAKVFGTSKPFSYGFTTEPRVKSGEGGG